ncbi:hypothetical protein CMK22_12875 [Candidatus Poribacteria bacterium]|nr:hypothetical protein [Candidatus Poribacteria bacterium]
MGWLGFAEDILNISIFKIGFFVVVVKTSPSIPPFSQDLMFGRFKIRIPLISYRNRRNKVPIIRIKISDGHFVLAS